MATRSLRLVEQADAATVDLVVPAEGDLDANVARVLAAVVSPATAGGA